MTSAVRVYRWRLLRRFKGLCTECGREPLKHPEAWTCERCASKKAAYQRKKRVDTVT